MIVERSQIDVAIAANYTPQVENIILIVRTRIARMVMITAHAQVLTLSICWLSLAVHAGNIVEGSVVLRICNCAA